MSDGDGTAEAPYAAYGEMERQWYVSCEKESCVYGRYFDSNPEFEVFQCPLCKSWNEVTDVD